MQIRGGHAPLDWQPVLARRRLVKVGQSVTEVVVALLQHMEILVSGA